jgi:WG containing repeat
MKLYFHILILLFTLSSTYSKADRITNAYKALQKGDFKKAKELLTKQNQKEKPQAGASHVWAYYYFTDANPAFRIDSAYFFVNEAIELYPEADPKDSKDWAKDGISIQTAQELKSAIEAKAFANAQALETVSAFRDFIAQFPTALEVAKARTLEQEAAWKDAEKLNSMDSYQYFIESYPQSPQITEAVKRRDRFIYDREVRQGRISDFERFLSRYPENVFVNEAIDKFFHLLLVENSEKTIQKFLRRFTRHPRSEEAWDRLWGIMQKQKSVKEFLNTYADCPLSDYLQQWAKVADLQYFPYFENEAYGYLDEKGQKHLKPDLENILPQHLCSTIQDKFILIPKNARLGLYDKLGKQILAPEYDAIEIGEFGLLKVSKNANQGIYHQNGKEIIPIRYDAVEILNQSFLKIKKNRRWGIATHYGQVILEPRYSEIEVKAENLLLLRSGSDFNLLNTQSLLEYATEKTPLPQLKYEGFETISTDFFKIRQNNLTGVLNQKLQTLIPAENRQLEFYPDLGFATQKDTLWKILDLKGRQLSPIGFHKVVGSMKYFGLKQGKKWGVMEKDGRIFQNFEFDSLAFIGEVLILWQKNKITAHFPTPQGVKTIDFTNYKNIQAERADYPDAQIFVQVENAQRQKGLFAQNSTKICNPAFQSIYPLSNEIINVKQNQKYGLVDSTGKILLQPKYDGITHFEGNYLTLILTNKYGLYHHKKNILIEPMMDAGLKVFGNVSSSQLYIGQKKGNLGLINAQNKTLIPFEFQDLIPWQDSVALALNKKNEWIFYNFAKSTPEKQRIQKTNWEEVKLLVSIQNDNLIQVKPKNAKYGIWHSKKGEIIQPDFENITNLGSPKTPFYFAETRIGANYQVHYINANGEIIWTKLLNEDDYYRLMCEK